MEHVCNEFSHYSFFFSSFFFLLWLQSSPTPPSATIPFLFFFFFCCFGHHQLPLRLHVPTPLTHSKQLKTQGGVLIPCCAASYEYIYISMEHKQAKSISAPKRRLSANFEKKNQFIIYETQKKKSSTPTNEKY